MVGWPPEWHRRLTVENGASFSILSGAPKTLLNRTLDNYGQITLDLDNEIVSGANGRVRNRFGASFVGAGQIAANFENDGRVVVTSVTTPESINLQGKYTQRSSGELILDIDTNGSERLIAAGLSLNGQLTLSLADGFDASIGTTFTVVQNDSAQPVSGRFIGLNDGAYLHLNQSVFQISYFGGDGNDVVLRYVGDVNATVWIENVGSENRLRYSATGDAVNALSISQGSEGKLVIADAPGVIIGYYQSEFTGGFAPGAAVRLSASLVSTVRADLSGGNDSTSFGIGLPIEVFGGDGDDTLVGGSGAAVLHGDDGNDTFPISSRSALVDIFDGGSGVDTIRNTAAADFVLSQFVSVAGSLTGTAQTVFGVEYLDANSRTIFGRSNGTADDTDANDDDRLDFSGLAILNPSATGIDGRNGDDWIVGTPYADVIRGSAGNDVLRGNSGDDYLDGGAGNDTLYGDDDNDVLTGSSGGDAQFGGAGADTFQISTREAFGDSFDGGSGTDIIRNTALDFVLSNFISSAGSAMGSRNVTDVEYLDANGRTLFGRSNGTADDTDANDDDRLDFSGLLILNPSATGIDGRNGDDWIIGTAAADIIFGSAGNDTISGGDGNDTIWGGAGNDATYGDAGNDLISGGGGVDSINGGVDGDVLSFLIADINNAEDGVTGFVAGLDRMRINWSAYSGASATPLVVFGTSPSGTGSASQIRYDNSNSSYTIIYLPGTGSNAFRRIKLLGNFTGHLFSLSDFELV